MEGDPLVGGRKNIHSLREKWQKTAQEHPYIARTCAIVIALLLIYGMYKLFFARHGHTPPKPIWVIPSQALSRDVPVYLSGLGNVSSRDSVTVRTQINGLLMQVLFTEGQMVKKGQLLAIIDTRPYDAQLLEYEGELKRDSALLSNAQLDLKRYRRLWKQDSISQQTLATQIALVHQYEGAVQTDRGLIETTKVNLIYCHIISPIDGRIGIRMVDPGNYIQVTDTNGIAVINMLDPITVLFTLPEDDIPQVLPLVYKNKKLIVQAYDRQLDNLLATGTLLTMDSQVNTSTGTVQFRAMFDNKTNILFPNQFVNIKLLVKTLHHAVVIPTAAIQHGDKGEYLYVINKDKTVTARWVKSGTVDGENSVISSGLNAGESVVVEGAEKLSNGASVLINKPSSRQSS